MRHFPLKTLILCILLPPIAYVYSIQLLEQVLQTRYKEALVATYTGDTRDLFDGSLRLQDAIKKNINAFITKTNLIDWGMRLTITVKTADGRYIFPDTYDIPGSDDAPLDYLTTAQENFRLLNEGLKTSVEVKIEHNTLISNLLLLSCVAVALLVFVPFYRQATQKIHREELAKQEIIDSLSVKREKSLNQLERLESQRMQLSENIEAMKSELERERQQASATEDDMIEELVALEEKIGEKQALQDSQLHEIDELKAKIKQFEKENEAKNRQRLKNVDATKKRFIALYKKLVIHDKAVEGFVVLTEEMKIKAEEVVHQLNANAKKVQIKRKVFGKKNRETVFEVIFAYKGRLYFRNLADSRVEVLIIGTKLTQNKDLTFLEKL